MHTFESVYDAIKPYTITDEGRCRAVWDHASRVLEKNIWGEFWECGVYKGGVAALLAASIQNFGQKRTLRLFDTFSGPSPKLQSDIDVHQPGEFKSSAVSVLTLIWNVTGEFGDTLFHVGAVPDTFVQADLALVRLDMDQYLPTKAAIEFAWPRLSKGGVLIVDDYRFPWCPGVTKAVDEYFGKALSAPLADSFAGQLCIVR